jgi:sugar lactone lactonase YvrE
MRQEGSWNGCWGKRDFNGTGKVTPKGRAEVFLKLPGSSTGNGIRFDVEGTMYIADYVGHNIFRMERGERGLSVHAHEPEMNQPNDLAITRSGVLFASDPNWRQFRRLRGRGRRVCRRGVWESQVCGRRDGCGNRN